MAGNALVFDLLAVDRASEVFRRVGESARHTGKQIREAGDIGATGGERLAKVGRTAFLGFAAAAAAAGVASIKMAGEFQTSTSVLQTAAGETSKGLVVVRKGILDIASSTGTTWQNLSEGMYQVEKAGYRGANGLNVLRAAAQGAKEENASLEVVTNAMTSVMASYHIGTDKSVQVMNALKTAAAGSKDTMENFAASLSTVLPIASAAGLDFAQVGGALAGLTRHGTSAHDATQELANTIRNLQAPNKQAVKTMDMLGVSSIDVATGLGKRGLGGTLEYLVDTISSKMGPSGVYLQSVFKQGKMAGQDLKIMLAQMAPETQKLSRAFLDGSMTVGDYRKAASKLPLDQLAMARQFAVLEVKTKGFSDALKAGGPMANTMADLLKKMLGGSTGLNTALMLTGENQAYVTEMTKRTADSLTHASKNVEGWDQTQKLFNTRMDMFRQRLDGAFISLGTKLIPVLLKFGDILTKHQSVVIALGSVIGVGLVGAMTAYIGTLVVGGVQSAIFAARVVLINSAVALAIIRTEGWAAAQALLNIALDANPIGLIVVGLAALAVGLYEAWKHSETFRDVCIAAFKAVGTAALDLVQGMLTGWQYVAKASDALFGTHLAKQLQGVLDKVAQLKSDLQHLGDKPVTINVKLASSSVDQVIQARGGKFLNDAPVHVHTAVHLDGKKVADVVTKHQSNAAFRGKTLYP